MHKKLVAALTIAIFVLSSVAIFTPASAHFTLGDYTSGFRYHANDFDTHFAGPTGYVWPGSGLADFSGTPGGFPTGYQTPWPGGNPPGQPQSVYQIEGNAYAPFGAILTSTEDHSNRGPLIFAFNLTCPGVNCFEHEKAGLGLTSDLEFTGITLYIPPEFDLSSVVANYGLVQQTFAVTSSDWSISQADMNDPIGPGWWVITWEGNIHWRTAHDYQEWYYIKINDVAAPMIAGKYFFKMFLWDSNSDTFSYQMVVPGSWDVHSNIVAAQPAACTGGGIVNGACWVQSSNPLALTFPVENWPVLLVKGEVDPGFVSGTIRYGTFNSSLYGLPINFPGMVDMVGTAIDPYLPDHPSTGRAVEARGYFNASAGGHFEVEGVAPGVYTIYAQAAGYPRQKIAENVLILPGQSFNLNGYLNPGAVVHGQIFSKHLFGEEPWPVNPRPVSVVLYSANDYAEDHIVAWSPWNKTHAPYMSYDWGLGYSQPEPLPVAYPWDTYTAGLAPTTVPVPFSYYTKTFTSPTPAVPFVYISHPAVTCGNDPVVVGFDPCGKPDGVGPAQYWWVDRGGVFTNGGGSNSFIFKFGVKGVYGAPTEIDGHIPQPYATWINGLNAGRYFVRAYLNGYVQTLQDGVTLDEASFEVSQNEWAGDVFLPFDLRVSSVINKTIHFHDYPGTLAECPIAGCAGNQAVGESLGNRYLIAEVRDSNGNLMGMNFTYVGQHNSSWTIQINGFGMMGPDPNTAFWAGPDLVNPGMKFSLYRYQGHHDYGLPSGTYVVRVYMRGYLQQTFESVSVTLSGSPALISNHMYRGARFNITVYSIDWEHPRVQRAWEFPTSRLRVYVYNEQGQSFQHVGTRYQPSGTPGGADFHGLCGLDASGPAIIQSGGLDPVSDHCHIIEWDGYKAQGTTSTGTSNVDTPPDFYAHVFYLSWYMPFGSESFFYYDGFLTYPGSYYRRGASTNFAARNALETGTYSFYGFSYGYLQAKQFSVYVMKGGFADIKLNLLQGVNITMNIPFKKEGIYSPTEFNMSMRVRVFDDQGRLIGTAQTKNPDVVNFKKANALGIGRWDGAPARRWDGFAWTYYVDPYAQSPNNPANTLLSIDASANTADTFLWYGNYYGTVDSWQAFDSDVLNAHGGNTITDFSDYNTNYGTYTTWIPAGTKQVRVFIAGVYDYVGDPLNQNFAGVLNGRTLDGKQPAQMYGIPGSSSTLPEGIPVSYSGKYYAEVDTWNEYPAPSFGGLDFVPPFSGVADLRNWYPPVEGLLQGDSFHTIPGASPDVFGFTGNSLAANGLGPYAQRMVWEIPNGHLGSEVSVVYELDKRGFISGNIYGFTWSDEIRPQSWVSVVASAATGNLTFTSWSWDAHYDMYLDAGQYELAIIAWSPSGQGYTVVKAPITISSGQSTTGVTFQLERSNIPIPEFSGLAIVAFSALAASLYLLRRKRR